MLDRLRTSPSTRIQRQQKKDELLVLFQGWLLSSFRVSKQQKSTPSSWRDWGIEQVSCTKKHEEGILEYSSSEPQLLQIADMFACFVYLVFSIWLLLCPSTEGNIHSELAQFGQGSNLLQFDLNEVYEKGPWRANCSKDLCKPECRNPNAKEYKIRTCNVSQVKVSGRTVYELILKSW